MTSRTYLTVLSWLWTLLLASSCLLPASSLRPFDLWGLFQYDKLIHLLLFAMLTALWLSALPQARIQRTGARFVLCLLFIGFGVSIEYGQLYLSAGRHFEVGDIIADASGVILGLIFRRTLVKPVLFVKKYLPFVN